MCIWIFLHLQYSSLQLKPQLQVVVWQSQLYHTWQPTGVQFYYPDENIIIMENTISDIIINITICHINYIPMHKYHIIIYNIRLYKKWLTVIQTKRERKRIMKRKSNRLKEWTKEIRRQLELERNKDTKREKKRKNKNLSDICACRRYKNK